MLVIIGGTGNGSDYRWSMFYLPVGLFYFKGPKLLPTQTYPETLAYPKVNSVKASCLGSVAMYTIVQGLPYTRTLLSRTDCNISGDGDHLDVGEYLCAKNNINLRRWDMGGTLESKPFFHTLGILGPRGQQPHFYRLSMTQKVMRSTLRWPFHFSRTFCSWCPFQTKKKYEQKTSKIL